MSAPVPAITVAAGGPVILKSLTSNVATLTTTSAHDLNVGDTITIAGVDGTFNGTGKVITAVTTYTVSWALTNANVTQAAATGTITPTTVVLNGVNPNRILVATDTAASSPVPTLRTWKNGATTIATSGGTNVVAPVLSVNAPGSISITCTETNGDAGGPVASSAVAITATDAVVTDYPQITMADGTVRCSPIYLPWEYKDPLIATPGIPNALNLNTARAYGTVAPTPLATVTG